MARTARMTADFGRPENRALKSVQNRINAWRTSGRSGQNELSNFFHYANPFRPMIEAIARAVDVSAAFSYLTVQESEYFTSGKYYAKIGDGGQAVGPFQMHPAAAAESGLTLAERQYFAPSACGAAKYLAKQVDEFKGSDVTFGILGYNQGAGGARAIIANKVAGNRYRDLPSRFGVMFSDIAEVNGIPASQLEYVTKFLAVYFIASDMRTYGFSLSPQAPSEKPKNGSVFPPAPIRDPLCRSTVESL